MKRARSALLLLLFAGVAVLGGLLIPSSVPLRLGAAAPPFELADLAGDPVSLHRLRGRVLFVNFWGTWCAPCRSEAPSLERLYQRLRGEGFEILAVSVDGPDHPDSVEAFREEFGLTFPILRDPGKHVYRAYQVTGVPETFMVDAAGRLVERFIGPRDWDQPRYARAVRHLLAMAPTAQGAEPADG